MLEMVVVKTMDMAWKCVVGNVSVLALGMGHAEIESLSGRSGTLCWLEFSTRLCRGKICVDGAESVAVTETRHGKVTWPSEGASDGTGKALWGLARAASTTPVLAALDLFTSSPLRLVNLHLVPCADKQSHVARRP